VGFDKKPAGPRKIMLLIASLQTFPFLLPVSLRSGGCESGHKARPYFLLFTFYFLLFTFYFF
jgi:hypothetical protein